MPEVPYIPPSGQRVLRIYKRRPDEVERFLEVDETDFERLQNSGLSLRKEEFGFEETLATLHTHKLKCLAVADCESLLSLGVSFLQFTDDNSQSHLSLRCAGCNLTQNGMPEKCVRADGECGFYLDVDDGISIQVAAQFTSAFIPEAASELLQQTNSQAGGSLPPSNISKASAPPGPSATLGVAPLENPYNKPDEPRPPAKGGGPSK